MEACLKLPKENRFIRVYMDIKGENLYLSVTNSSSGKPNKSGERFMSSKVGSHGFGLLRMEGIVRKYGGIHKTNGEMDAFTAEILLPI
jgi:sensor histidine kinase regulating citrate/malate metabolism